MGGPTCHPPRPPPHRAVRASGEIDVFKFWCTTKQRGMPPQPGASPGDIARAPSAGRIMLQTAKQGQPSIDSVDSIGENYEGLIMKDEVPRRLRELLECARRCAAWDS